MNYDDLTIKVKARLDVYLEEKEKPICTEQVIYFARVMGTDVEVADDKISKCGVSDVFSFSNYLHRNMLTDFREEPYKSFTQIKSGEYILIRHDGFFIPASLHLQKDYFVLPFTSKDERFQKFVEGISECKDSIIEFLTINTKQMGKRSFEVWKREGFNDYLPPDMSVLHHPYAKSYCLPNFDKSRCMTARMLGIRELYLSISDVEFSYDTNL